MSLEDPDLERDVLAGIIDAPPDARAITLSMLNEWVFTDPDRRTLLRGIAEIVECGEQLDIGSLAQRTGFAQARLVAFLGGRFVPSVVLPGKCTRLCELAAKRRALAGLVALEGRIIDPRVRLVEVRTELARLDESLEVSPFTLDDAVEAEAFAAQRATQPEWVVPDLLRLADRTIVTGPEGHGKSEWIRQFAVQTASGVHPVHGHPMPRQKVLLVDLENEPSALGERINGLLHAAGERYDGRLFVKSWARGIDLLTLDGYAWLARLLEIHRPALLAMGPIYKMSGGVPKDEEIAQALSRALDRLRIRFSCALLLEHHSPHGEGNDRAGWRPFGASLWLRWPEFGFGLAPDPKNGSESDVRHWRGARDRTRKWPKRLRSSGNPWPWEVIE